MFKLTSTLTDTIQRSIVEGRDYTSDPDADENDSFCCFTTEEADQLTLCEALFVASENSGVLNL